MSRKKRPGAAPLPSARTPDTASANPSHAFAALDRTRNAAIAIALLTVVFFVAAHGLDGSALFKGYDWQESFTWQRDFLSAAVHRGELPLWNPYTFGGHPFLADPQTMVLYPGVVLWLVLPKTAALPVDAFLHYFLAAFFMFLFVRALGVRPIFAILSGALFSFCGFNFIHLGAGHINFHAGVAWLPAAFFCVERAITNGRRFSVWWLWGAGALGLEILCGSPPVLWMTFLFAGLYGCARALAPLDAPIDFLFNARRAATSLAGLAVMFALGIGIGCAQLLPTLEFASAGVRPSSSFPFSTYLELPPRNLVNLIFPQGKIDNPEIPQASRLIPEGEYNGYIGILPLGLGLAGLAFVRRRGVVALLAVALFAFLLMLGDLTPLFYLFWLIVPGLSRLRLHCRELLMFDFALIAAAGIALEEFASRAIRVAGSANTTNPVDESSSERAKQIAFWIGAGGLGLFALASFAKLFGNPTAPPWQMAIILLAFLGIWASRNHGAKPAVALAILALGVIDVSANAAAADVNYFQNPNPVPAAEAGLSQTMRADGGLFRAWFSKRACTRQRFLADRFPTIDGYEAMIPGRWYRFIHDMTESVIKEQLVAEATQDMFFRRPSLFPFRVLNVKYTTVPGQDRTYRLETNPDPDPRAYLAAEAIVTSDDPTATALLKSVDFDPHHTAILDLDPADPPPSGVAIAKLPAIVPFTSPAAPPGSEGKPAAPPPPPKQLPLPAFASGHSGRSLSEDGRVSQTEAGRVEITAYGLNEIRMKTQALASSILVLSEGWFPGWRATVDGAGAPIYRSQVTIRAVSVPAGEHEVVFRYRPSSLLRGLVISLLSLAAGALGIFFLSRSERSHE